jgi:predicted SAM-dependent methyltransferase
MDHAGKIRLLTAGRDLSRSAGIEIGARGAPLIRREHGNILYADHAPTEELRANLPPRVDPASLVEVDIVTRGGPLAAVAPSRADYIVASHVAEHVPDLLGWLNDLHDVLQPGGTLGLAIPDRRFTFDIFRNESTVAEAVEAYLLGATRPSLRQIFDSAWQSVDVTVSQGWDNDVPQQAGIAHRMERLRPAFELVREVHRSHRYNDAHCWVFTPASFLDIADQASRLGLFPFLLETFHPTGARGYEFYAVLRRTDTASDTEIARTIARARLVLASWAPEHAYAATHQPPEVAALRAALHAMRVSTSWRMTAPLRRIFDAIKK